MSSKILRVYQALENLAEAGFCRITQAELSRLTNIPVRTLYRITHDLKSLGLIKVTPAYENGKRIGVTVEMTRLTATGWQEGDSSNCHVMAVNGEDDLVNCHRMAVNGNDNLVNCHRMAVNPPINHDDDDKKKLSKNNLILSALDFLDLNGRLKLAKLPHVTPGLAEQARRYVEHLKATKQWKKGSPGRIYRLIEANEVPTQFEMPAAIAEIPQAKIQLAQYTPEEVAEINQTHPLALTGLIFGEDGKWR